MSTSKFAFEIYWSLVSIYLHWCDVMWCDVTSEPWEDSGSFCNLTKQKVGCLVKFRPCLTFYELKELKKCLLKDLENGMSAYEDKQLLKSCSIYKELFVKWAWILARLYKGGLISESVFTLVVSAKNVPNLYPELLNMKWKSWYICMEWWFGTFFCRKLPKWKDFWD